MSIERYFQRAHDEARRLLREMPWLANPTTGCFGLAGLQRILDRAMFEPGALLLRSGGVTLGPGEGAEARRLLELVAWDRVPQARWPEVFDTLRMGAAWRSAGHENWLTTTRALLEEDGYLAGGAKRKAA